MGIRGMAPLPSTRIGRDDNDDNEALGPGFRQALLLFNRYLPSDHVSESASPVPAIVDTSCRSTLSLICVIRSGGMGASPSLSIDRSIVLRETRLRMEITSHAH
jgi:hypothetical protein